MQIMEGVTQRLKQRLLSPLARLANEVPDLEVCSPTKGLLESAAGAFAVEAENEHTIRITRTGSGCKGPLEGDPFELLQRQHALPAPCKVCVDGTQLVMASEFWLDEGTPTTTLLEVLKIGAASLDIGRSLLTDAQERRSLRPQKRDLSAAKRLAEVLPGLAVPFVERSSGWAGTLDTPRFLHRIRAEVLAGPQGDMIRVATTGDAANAEEHIVARAVACFLAEAAARFRLVRFSLDRPSPEVRKMLPVTETVFPASLLTKRTFQSYLEAIIAGSTRTRDEASALTSPEVAQAYLTHRDWGGSETRFGKPPAGPKRVGGRTGKPKRRRDK